ncbi:class I SAM-dependent methyltransferase [Methylobacterium trifolii]|uniref:class I SAM-dependent methyltransferase n=1 Tax=Methylobacterium trifolii TaxID=1003092 RepID=UPI001EDFA988|nr:class I SAM-dependent methyltransferase [Methylobacterium trifolii]
MSRDDCFFYHTIDLADGTTAEGHWDLRGRYADYTGHIDLTDARVLDVGAASGFLSFSAEAAGAREVVSFDLDTAARQHLLPFRGSPYVTDHAAWVEAQTKAFDTWKNAYWFTHRNLGSRARAIYGDVYDLPEGIGSFDVVILGAILEHLGDPIRAIGSVATVASRRIVINTDIIPGEEPLARFNGDAAHPERSYIFWTYTLETYRRILAICDFEIETVRDDTYRAFSPLAVDDGWRLVPRTTIVARRVG